MPHHSKLKYTQLFNGHDRGKSGYLSGVQARGILVQTQLPQPLLARIWYATQRIPFLYIWIYFHIIS